MLEWPTLSFILFVHIFLAASGKSLFLTIFLLIEAALVFRKKTHEDKNVDPKFHTPWVAVTIDRYDESRFEAIAVQRSTFLTHGSRCVVSAWIPVSNYRSTPAH